MNDGLRRTAPVRVSAVQGPFLACGGCWVRTNVGVHRQIYRRDCMVASPAETCPAPHRLPQLCPNVLSCKAGYRLNRHRRFVRVSERDKCSAPAGRAHWSRRLLRPSCRYTADSPRAVTSELSSNCHTLCMSLIPVPASPEDARLTAAFLRWGAASTMTAVGVALGGPVGGAAGYLLTEAAQNGIGRIADRYFARHWLDTTETFQAGCVLANRSPDELVDGILCSKRSEELASRALIASAETTVAHKSWLLGRVIANAALGGLQLDVEELIVESTLKLRPAHASVLALISSQYVQEDGQAWDFWRETWIVERVSGLGVGVTPVLKVLESAGLAFAGSGAIPDGIVTGVPAATRPDAVRWFITPYGRLMQDRMLEAAVNEGSHATSRTGTSGGSPAG
jgi:hypothetical protein